MFRNVDDFLTGAFYSTPTTIRHKRVSDMNALKSEFVKYPG